LKYPKSHKEKIRDKLLYNASEQIRDLGLKNVSVKSVMRSENMTVGGFYTHFNSKDDLLIQAIQNAFATTYIEFYDKINTRTNTTWTKKVIESYLSHYHRDNVAISCPAATLMNDVSKASKEVRIAFESNLKKLIETFESRVGKDKAIGLVAMLAGGLQLARSTSNDEYSNEILQACIRSATTFLNA
jgi:TetR/AcrR family transcriptional repressor of nem operon